MKTREDFYFERGDDTVIYETVCVLKSEFQAKTTVTVFEILFYEKFRKHIVTRGYKN